jgi:hypothetical protein
MTSPLRLMIFDATCRGALIGLSHAWRAGAHLYGALGRLDATFGATSWDEALRWLARHDAIGEIQFWGHGKWGAAKIDGEPLGEESLARSHAHRPLLDAVRERLGPDATWWFRTCETFGATSGQRFAQAFAEDQRCRVAGHTFIIGYWQSGLHSLAPGEAPRWPVDEGLLQGSPEAPQRALWSKPWSPNTVSCLAGAIPSGY